MKLSEKSIEFAKNHIQNFYDSDFFVKPFEFVALWENWDEVKKYLLETEISSFGHPPFTFAAPKPKGGYRIVHQLEPLDSLVYTALAYEVAESVERYRIPVEKQVVCSYRVSTDTNGNFFIKDSGYEDFFKRCDDLANSYSYVLVADITDFYNNIYLHRLQNSLERCGLDFRDISKDIERFLIKLNNGVSRGIPVGPAASIIMAEASLIDIDEFILDKGVDYVRYVDDFRIFSNSRPELNLLLHDLTCYLYSTHRFNLSSEKTEIFESKRFIKEYLQDPEVIERDEIHKELENITTMLSSDYALVEPITDIESLPNEDRFEIEASVLQKLLDKIIQRDVLDLGLARHILRRAKKLKSRAIVVKLLENFDFFAPVIRDVVLYLNAITNQSMIEHNHDRFIQILSKSDTINLPYVRYWMRDYFVRYPDFVRYQPISDFLDRKNDDIRSGAIFAKKNRKVSWVRSHKDKLSNHGSWDRRAIIFSATALSRDEKNHWMNLIMKTSDNLVDKSLAKLVKSY